MMINQSNSNLFAGSGYTDNTNNSHLSDNTVYNGPTGPSGHSGAVGVRSLDPFDAYTADLELAADLLATGSITGPDYFRVKHMIKSSDPEVKALGRTFLHEKSKL